MNEQETPPSPDAATIQKVEEIFPTLKTMSDLELAYLASGLEGVRVCAASVGHEAAQDFCAHWLRILETICQQKGYGDWREVVKRIYAEAAQTNVPRSDDVN